MKARKKVPGGKRPHSEEAEGITKLLETKIAKVCHCSYWQFRHFVITMCSIIKGARYGMYYPYQPDGHKLTRE